MMGFRSLIKDHASAFSSHGLKALLSSSMVCGALGFQTVMGGLCPESHLQKVLVPLAPVDESLTVCYHCSRVSPNHLGSVASGRVQRELCPRRNFNGDTCSVAF